MSFALQSAETGAETGGVATRLALKLVLGERTQAYEPGFEPRSLHTLCAGPEDFSAHELVCADGSGVVLAFNCSGVAGSYASYCPARVPTCRALDLDSGAFAAAQPCTVVGSSAPSSFCCSASSSSASPNEPSARTRACICDFACRG